MIRGSFFGGGPPRISDLRTAYHTQRIEFGIERDCEEGSLVITHVGSPGEVLLQVCWSVMAHTRVKLTE